jgi:hypothetical protein
VKPTSVLVVDVADLKDAYVLDGKGSTIGRVITVILGDKGSDRLLAKLVSGDHRELPLSSLAIDGLGRLWLVKPWQNIAINSFQKQCSAERERQLVSIIKRT